MYITVCEIDRQSRFNARDRILRAGALGWPRGMGWGGRWEGGSGWGTHEYTWLIHVNVWPKPPQYYKVISLQLKWLIYQKKKKKKNGNKDKENCNSQSESWSSKWKTLGVPKWSSSWESTWQCRKDTFIPIQEFTHAAEELSLCAITT